MGRHPKANSLTCLLVSAENQTMPSVFFRPAAGRTTYEANRPCRPRSFKDIPFGYLQTPEGKQILASGFQTISRATLLVAWTRSRQPAHRTRLFACLLEVRAKGKPNGGNRSRSIFCFETFWHSGGEVQVLCVWFISSLASRCAWESSRPEPERKHVLGRA